MFHRALVWLKNWMSTFLESQDLHTSQPPTLLMDSSRWSLEQPADLTERIKRTVDYPTDTGGYGNIWRCILQDGEGQIMVRRTPAPTIAIFPALSRLQ